MNRMLGSTKHLSLLRRWKAELGRTHHKGKKLKLFPFHENNSFLFRKCTSFTSRLLSCFFSSGGCKTSVFRAKTGEEDKNYRVSTSLLEWKPVLIAIWFLFIADGLSNNDLQWWLSGLNDAQHVRSSFDFSNYSLTRKFIPIDFFAPNSIRIQLIYAAPSSWHSRAFTQLTVSCVTEKRTLSRLHIFQPEIDSSQLKSSSSSMSELNDDDKWIVSGQSAHSDSEIHYLHLNFVCFGRAYRDWAADEMFFASN